MKKITTLVLMIIVIATITLAGCSKPEVKPDTVATDSVAVAVDTTVVQ